MNTEIKMQNLLTFDINLSYPISIQQFKNLHTDIKPT